MNETLDFGTQGIIEVGIADGQVFLAAYRGDPATTPPHSYKFSLDQARKLLDALSKALGSATR